ncbi:hypothetical protein ACFO3O_14720 [Dokdonia ponticola]|uniref:Uncharacterized protein n=1 Tax=Dokdonia ponticola TaxID=2041041 RepID=A0ABV9HYB5_9FLAO
MKSIFYYSVFIFLSALSISCGDADMESVKVTTEPSDKIIRELRGTDFSIVLNDMNISEKDNKRLFEHKYHILKVIDDSLVVDSLSWKPVNQAFFEKHEKDLGMEIVSNHGGKLSRNAQPVGFGWAIGNPKYGEWEEVTKTQDSTSTASTTNSNSSERRWRSHGPSLLFWYWMLRRPAYQRDYAGYRTASANGRSYYGSQPNGTSRYGMVLVVPIKKASALLFLAEEPLVILGNPTQSHHQKVVAVVRVITPPLLHVHVREDLESKDI